MNGFVARNLTDTTIAPLFPDEETVRVVPRKHYLALGDNTMSSSDGRTWGYVPRDEVVGKASFVFWPIGGRDDIPSRFGWSYP